jgi:hypothetical protein
MTIENAKYDVNKHNKTRTINCTINGVFCNVPLDPANTDYQAILEWAKIDGNTIADAD